MLLLGLGLVLGLVLGLGGSCWVFLGRRGRSAVVLAVDGLAQEVDRHDATQQEQDDHEGDEDGLHPPDRTGDSVLVMPSSLVLKLTEGASSAEKVNQAFTVAATAAASGVPTSLWLTGEAVWFAVPGRAASFVLDLATPLEELLSTVIDLGTLTVCAQCAARRSLSASDLVPGVRVAGAATFVEEALAEGAQALVY